MATAQQITDIYRTLLGREPDQGGLNYWQQFDPSTIQNGILGSQEYKTYQANAPVKTTQDLVNQMTGYLNPLSSFIKPNQTAEQSYQSYSAPQQAVMDALKQSMQQYNQRYYIDPFLQQYAGAAAAGNAMNMGNGAYNFETARAGTVQPLENKILEAQNQYNSMLAQNYGSALKNFYNNQWTALGNTNKNGTV